MACLFCGKRVSMVRQKADPDFCSDDHRRRYHEMARAALSRLGDLEGEAPGAEPPPRTPDVYVPAPEPPSPPAKPVASGSRRRSPQAHGPRLVVTEPPPPSTCDLFLEPASPYDFDFGLRNESYADFVILPVFYEHALAAMRRAISARGLGGDHKYDFLDVPPALASAARLREALHLEPAIRMGMSAGSDVPAAMLPGSRISVSRHYGPFDFFPVEPRPRRRFARSRTVPAPRLCVRTVVMPREPVPFEACGIAACEAIPHRISPFEGAGAFASGGAGVRERAARIPVSPISRRQRAEDTGLKLPAGICGFEKYVTHMRRGDMLPVLAGRSFGMARMAMPPHAAGAPRFGRTPTCGMTALPAHSTFAGTRESRQCEAILELDPVCRLLSPLPPARHLKLADSTEPMVLQVRSVTRVAQRRVVEFKPGAASAGPALPRTPAACISGVPAAAGIEKIISVPANRKATVLSASGEITLRQPRLPIFNPRVRRGRVDTTNPIPVRHRPQALESVPMDGFGAILRAPEVLVPTLGFGVSKYNGLPIVGHEAARPPKARVLASVVRSDEVRISGVPVSSLALPAPKRSMDRRPAVHPAESRDALIETVPASRSVRMTAAGTIGSASGMRLNLTAPARLVRPTSESAIITAPGAVLPGALATGPAAIADVGSPGVLPVSLRRVEHATARQTTLAAVPVLVEADFAPAEAMALPGIRAAAYLYSPGLRPGQRPAVQRRDEMAQTALCFAYPGGVFILPVNPRTPPVAGYPLFAFTYSDIPDSDGHASMVARCVEHLLPALVIPESKPGKRVQRLPLESGAITGLVVAQAGERELVPFGAMLPRGGKRFLPVLDGEPDAEDREELQAAAGSGGGMWRFFR